MIEEWKDIVGFEGKYMISNIGNTKSLEREFIKSNGYRAYFPERVLKTFKRGKDYRAVKLCDNGVEKTFSVHVLVAKHFINGFFDNAQVNHEDGNKHNNIATNLSWTNNSGNQIHAYKMGLNKMTPERIAINIKRLSAKKSIPVIDTMTGVKYNSIRDASKASGINENKLFAWITGRNKNKSSYARIENKAPV